MGRRALFPLFLLLGACRPHDRDGDVPDPLHVAIANATHAATIALRADRSEKGEAQDEVIAKSGAARRTIATARAMLPGYRLDTNIRTALTDYLGRLNEVVLREDEYDYLRRNATAADASALNAADALDHAGEDTFDVRSSDERGARDQEGVANSRAYDGYLGVQASLDALRNTVSAEGPELTGFDVLTEPDVIAARGQFFRNGS